MVGVNFVNATKFSTPFYSQLLILMSLGDSNTRDEVEENVTAIRASTEDDYVHINNELSSDDEYLLSDQENPPMGGSNNHLDSQFHDLSSLNNHAKYFSNSILQSLDSSDVDKALVLEAQISGNLNNENQKLVEKTSILQAKLGSLQSLFDAYFGTKDNSKISRVERLRNEINAIEKRLERLKYGRQVSFPTSLIKGQKCGVIEEYPVEYFEARDKVLERIQE